MSTASVAEAQRVLRLLGFDAERCNERSALTLLALARLRPGQEWADASGEPSRTVEIMEAIRDRWSVDYKPNTRETIRRQTLHQFVAGGLLVENPDQPDRPVNSPKYCYAIRPEALVSVRSVGSETETSEIKAFVNSAETLVQQYAAERALERIEVTLPDGRELTLSPGGQNVLLRSMVEEFCSRFTPGGQVLYVGDADEKLSLFEEAAFLNLGLQFDHHGKMPDLVVYMHDKNWLVLLEAASSHGPVDAKRHAELSSLFANATAGLVYVSCFPDRATLRKYLASIAWESEVWCSDDPTHLIHFNGVRFLGPYA